MLLSTFTPTTFADSNTPGAGSLRDAIIQANSDAGTATDTIQLHSGTYTLSIANSGSGHENQSATGDLNITGTAHTLIIQGQGSTGSNATIIKQTVQDRVFEIASGVTVVFQNVQVTGGVAVDDGTAGALPFNTAEVDGGGILNQGGNVTLTDVAVVGNQAGVAGSTTFASLTADGTAGNNAFGGGIFSTAGTFTMNGATAGASLLENNTAVAGDGITGSTQGDRFNAGGDVVGPGPIQGTDGGSAAGGGFAASNPNFSGIDTITNTLIENNIAQGGTGGVGAMGITFVTPGGNFVDNGYRGGNGGGADGGGVRILTDSSGSDLLTNDTISGNQCLGGTGGAGGPSGDAPGPGGQGGTGGSVNGGGTEAAGGVTVATSLSISNNIAHAGDAGATGSGGSAGPQGFGGVAAGGGWVSTDGANQDPSHGLVAVEVTVTQSTINGNQALGGNGGGLGNSGVTGDADGGGVFTSIEVGGTSLTNDTIVGNTVVSGPGSVAFAAGVDDSFGPLSVTNLTITGNTAQAGSGGSASVGGIAGASSNNNGGISMQNTIVAGNTAPTAPDVAGSYSSDHNLIGNADGATAFSTANGDKFGTTASPLAPRLGSLQFNGGPTQTEALLSNSPAIGAGDPSADTTAQLTTDQRGAGFPRVINGVADIGAVDSLAGSSSGGSAGLTSSILKSTVPASVVAGSAVRGTVTVHVTNTGSMTDSGFNTIAVFATTNGSATGATPLGQIRPFLHLKAGASENFLVPVHSSSLGAGTYTQLVQTTDPSSNVLTATGPALSVAAAFLSFSETVTTVGLSSSVVSGSRSPASARVVITNNGNVNSHGPITISVSASTAPGVAGTLINSMTTSRSIRANGGTAVILVPFKALPDLADNSYFIDATVTDPMGGTSIASTTGTTTIAAPFIDIQNLWNGKLASKLVAGRHIAVPVLLQNVGNSTATGSADVTLVGTDSTGATVTLATGQARLLIPAGQKRSAPAALTVAPGLASGTYQNVLLTVSFPGDTNASNNTTGIGGAVTV